MGDLEPKNVSFSQESQTDSDMRFEAKKCHLLTGELNL